MADLTLTLNPTTTPFPWAALITAYYVSANVKFDVEAKTPTLQTKAATVTDLDAILNELSPLVAQGDSTKVGCTISPHKSITSNRTLPASELHVARKDAADRDSLPRGRRGTGQP